MGENTVTISTEEYKELLKADIKLNMVLEYLNEESFVSSNDICKILGVKRGDK